MNILDIFSQDSGTQTYKQVAAVEHFFDIIYHVHVALGSKRCGRHAGQKRTYRTVSHLKLFYLIFPFLRNPSLFSNNHCR